METCYSGPNYLLENTGGPSRFDLPEIEELTLGVFSSFDDITYNTKPIVRAPDKFTNDTKSERKLSNAIMPDIFLSYGNDENLIKKRNQNDSSDDDWAGGESFLNFEDDQMSSMNKRIRYDHDEKENFSTSQVNNLLGSDNTSATSLNNHAKIIREVLKKYPHLVKNNKNIRLKIMHKESKNMEFSTAGKTKVSYIVLKSDSLMTDSVDKMGLSNTNSDIRLETSEMGPWQCSKCNLEEHYIDYYMYRRHMQDVHEERFDPRICEHCGYKATKRNILMYHMYTKHSVLPPKNMSFPKCQACSYIALSESLLLRHQINHKHQLPTLAFQHFSCRSFQCNESEKVFNDASTFTCKIKDKDVLSTDINDLNIKETSCYCLHCGKYFMNMKKMNDNKNSHTEISKLLEQSTIKSTVSEQTSNIENFRSLSSSSLNLTSSFRTGDILKPMTANEQKFTKLKASNNTCSNPQLQHQQVVMLINDDNYSVGASKDECSIDAINNEIVIQNSDGNMIIYVQDVNNIINSHDFRTNPADENYINSSSTDEILEEVVEELETIENDNEEKRLDCEKRKMTEILNHDANDTQIKNIFHSKKIADISSNAEKVIQYVEEETEILEYETCSNA